MARARRREMLERDLAKAKMAVDRREGLSRTWVSGEAFCWSCRGGQRIDLSL